MKRIVLNAPCMPKSYYHCGNAISQVITDILYRYYKTVDPDNTYYYLLHSWNLHGLPSEKSFFETHGYVGTYEEIRTFTNQQLDSALKQKEIFINSTGNEILSFQDTDEEAIQFAEECFLKLAGSGYIVIKNEECYFNIKKVFSVFHGDLREVMGSINVVPSYHLASILSNQKYLNDLYPITKHRVFAASVRYRGSKYLISPIFQAFIMPLLLCQIHNIQFPAFIQATGYGHSMLKWHYLLTLVSLALTKECSYANLILHGSLFGTNGEPMSKHKNNIVKPSDLFEIKGDKRFVRYALIKSIPFTDKKIQINLAKDEYTKVEQKIMLLGAERFSILNEEEIYPFIQEVFNYLAEFKIQLAFEAFYLALKKAHLEKGQEMPHPGRRSLFNLYRIFLSDQF